jgi:heavy metal sensor kinase
MKIFKSIKWRLQIWYGLILVVVLAGFGFTAYQLERGRQFGRINDELQRRFGILANALHRPPSRGSNGGEQPMDRPPPDQFSDDGPPGQNPRPPLVFHLPPEAAGLFGTNDPNNFYFIITRFGEELARSTNVPQGEEFHDRNPGIQLNPHPELPANENLGNVNKLFVSPNQKIWTPKGLQEIKRDLPSGEQIAVGCSIIPELQQLHLTALKLAGFGGIILFFGLAGGWWIVSRSLRPVVDISAAAVKISAGDLSQRINVAEAESELGQLAAVLNSTFARLESAFAQQKQFASDAAHELRTPVAVILTQTQTALNRERDAASYKETVEACQRAAQRMRKLIKSLLELARLDAGQEILKRMSFDFSKTISDCVELIRPLADGRGVKIFTELEPLEISGDSERLAQVVTNLLTNAIQYNRDGGEARVKLESQNGMAVLTVTDTGGGIPPEDLPHIFERFYRADKSRSTGGNGLGLAISKAVVEAHGGTIEVSSQFERGTTFVVRLPMTS